MARTLAEKAVGLDEPQHRNSKLDAPDLRRDVAVHPAREVRHRAHRKRQPLDVPQHRVHAHMAPHKMLHLAVPWYSKEHWLANAQWWLPKRQPPAVNLGCVP